MNIYDTILSPLEKSVFGKLREQYVGYATGVCLEIGVGTGVNSTYYNYADIKEHHGIDLNISDIARERFGDKVTLTKADALNLPYPSEYFDTVVCTLTLCSVNDTEKAIIEIKRVLKPLGKLVFIEHILPPDKFLGTLFKAAKLPWKLMAGGCDPTKETDILLHRHFDIDLYQTAANGIVCAGVGRKRVDKTS